MLTPSQLNELALLARDTRSEVAFRELYKHTHHTVRACYHRSFGYQEGVDDFTQDVYLQAFTKIHHWRGDAAFKTWLVSIAITETIVRFRRQRAKRRDESRTLSIEDVNQDDSTFTHCLSTNETDTDVRVDAKIRVEKMWAQYPKTMSIIDLQANQGLSAEELGEAWVMTELAARSRLFRAKRYIRERILALQATKV